MPSPVEVTISPAGLERERANLGRGSVVADGVTGVALGAFVDLALAFPSGERLLVQARAVLSGDAATVFAFEGHDRAALARILAGPAAPGPAPPPTGEAEPEEAEPAPAHVQERLRGLSVVEQLRVARDGTTTERIALERLYGKVVWEAILRNTRVTVPEVSRLARMGTMPRPLLELVVGNPAWLQVPQVRRALLANPRLSPDMVQKVLAALPREELRLVPQITAYPPAVRMAAKALAKR